MEGSRGQKLHMNIVPSDAEFSYPRFLAAAASNFWVLSKALQQSSLKLSEAIALSKKFPGQ